MSTPLNADRTQIEAFVGAVFPYASEGGVISLRTFPDQRSGPPVKIALVALSGSDLSGLSDRAVVEAQRAARYIEPAVFCPPLAAFAGERAREQDLIEAYTLSVECDVAPKAAQGRLTALLGKPTVTVKSGGEWTDPETGEIQAKLHLHWRLTEPATGEDLPRLKRARRLAASLVGGDPTNVPAVHPIRWPGSWHRKAKPRLVIIAELNQDAEIDLGEALERLCEAAPLQGAERPASNAGAADERDLADLIRGVASGDSLHPNLVPLAARFVGAGMPGGAVVNTLRGLMEASAAQRDDRWRARWDDLPRTVSTAEAKFRRAEQEHPGPRQGLHSLAFDAASLAGRAVPERLWHVPEKMPGKTVTLLQGDGGTGKSLLALQLCVSTVLGLPWLGLEVRRGRALYLSAEDDADEIHRRLNKISTDLGVSLDQFCGLEIMDASAGDVVFAVTGRNGSVEMTDRWQEFERVLAQREQTGEPPALIVLDNLADIFGADENNRAQTRQFVSHLRRWAQHLDCAILLLGHPSLAGMNSGSGSSGSTAWNNSVRSRLYLTRPTGDQAEFKSPNIRTLKVMKANYSVAGGKLELVWRGGVFQPLTSGTESTSNEFQIGQNRVDGLFLTLLDRYEAQGRKVTHTSGHGYAPAVFAKEDEARGVGSKAFVAAMNRHFAAKVIRIEQVGPPSRRVSRIVRASEVETA